MKKLLITFLALMIYFVGQANNLSITNVTLTGHDSGNDFTLVQFDLSWDNSWRSSNRKDAAWIFVKYKIGGVWYHATINYVDGTAANDGHTEASGSAIETPSDGMGVFIYRDADGSGANSFTTLQLRWNYGIDGLGDDDIVDIQVFGIEMVFVPTGAFAAGSGGGNSNEFTVTTINTGLATTTPTGSGSLGGEAGGYPTSQISPSNNSWPNGYNAFYCMKYEMSLDQYSAFLNTLTRTQQQTRTNSILFDAFTNIYVMSNTSSVSNGNTIVAPASGNGTTDPITFSTTTPDRACNWLSWSDGVAYGDWAGLRPMTDLEYEKAGRGTIAPVADAFAWGSTDIHASTYTLTNAGMNSESISNPGTSIGNASYPTTDGAINRPLRCGIFAASASNQTRDETGATYYGIMEMTGNLSERIVSIGLLNGRNFTGLHGDGSLDSSGDEDVTNWPNGANGFRGGCWGCITNSLRLSDRTTANSTGSGRGNTQTFRLVRTGP